MLPINRMTFLYILVGGRSNLGHAICAIDFPFVPLPLLLYKRSSRWITDKGEMTRHRHWHGTKKREQRAITVWPQQRSPYITEHQGTKTRK